MRFEQDHIYHVYNRGNNSQPIFFTKANYLFFLQKIRTYLLPDCAILAFCLMPNHYHLLIKPTEQGCVEEKNKRSSNDFTIQSLTRNIATLQSSYTRAINVQENSKGSLFQQKTKAKSLELSAWPGKNAIAICMHYIHQNPLKAGLVTRLEDWEFSSYRDYAGLRNGTLCNQALGFELSGLNKEAFIADSHSVMRDEIIGKVLY